MWFPGKAWQVTLNLTLQAWTLLSISWGEDWWDIGFLCFWLSGWNDTGPF
jgi:hypothetical protein